MDWQANLELFEKLAAASRDAADSAPHGSIYHLEAAKFLAMCQALEEFSHEQEAVSEAPAQDAAEAGAGTAEGGADAAGPAEPDTETSKRTTPRGRRR